MNIYMITDLEGVAGIFNWGYDLKKEGKLEWACGLMTDEINAAVKGALAGGAKEVLVHEAHSIFSDKLHPQARLVKGSINVSSKIDAFFFIGQHAMSGVKNGILSHTGSSRSIQDIWLNSRKIGELGLCAALAGEKGIPVALVTGDEAVCQETKEFFGNCETIAVKWGSGLHSGTSLSPEESCQAIAEGAKKALTRITEFKPYQPSGPFELKISYRNPYIADECEIIPSVERFDSRTTISRGKTYKEVFNLYLCQGLVLRRIDVG